MKDLAIISNDIDPIGVDQLISEFFSGKNENTLLAYRRDLKDFCSFLNMDNISMATQTLISSGQGAANLRVLQYKNDMTARNLSPATINRRLSAIRSLLKLARTLALINWGIEIQNQKSMAYRETRGPSVNQIQDILTGLQINDTPKNKRDTAIVTLLFTLGLRVSELVGLNLEHLDFENKRVSILGKARTEREWLSVPQSAIEALQQWLSVRPINSGNAVFVNFDRSRKSSSRRITRNGIYKLIKSIANINPHAFRRSAITTAVNEAQKNNINLRDVLQYSRHSKLEVLQLYVDSIDNKQGQLSELVSKTVMLKKVD